MLYNCEKFHLIEIYGDGDMQSYTSNNQPWYAVRKQIDEIIIGNEIDMIGDFAFEETKAQTVDLKQVQTIGSNAFKSSGLILLLVHTGQLARVGGFTRALQAYHHNHCGGLGADLQLGLRAAHETGKLLVDDLDHLLTGEQGLHDLGTHGALGNDLDEVLDHLEVDVGLQQSELDLAHTRLDVGLGQGALTAEFLKGLIQLFAETLKHWFFLLSTEKWGMEMQNAKYKMQN